MNPWIKVLLCLAAVAVVAIVEYVIIKCRLKKAPLFVEDAETETPEVAAEEVAAEEVATEEVVEETVAETVVEEVAASEVVADETAAEETEEVEEVADAGDAQDADIAKRIAFGSKLLTFNEKVQGYFNTIYNKFISLRKINPRISTKGVSFRLGRDLVARLTIRGKTMRLHLALNVADFDSSIYFQKDMGDVKSYVEIPFMVKVRSDRGMKNAMKLIDALIESKGIEYKVRYNEVDAIALLKDKIDD